MNVLSLLEDEIKDKDWTMEEKIRYLYLRSCLLFTYDYRFRLYGDLDNAIENRQKIKDRQIDLENVDDNRVVCTSFSKEVLKKILEELLSLDCKIESKMGISDHTWLSCLLPNKEKIVMDAATYYGDIKRTKMHLSTIGYQSENPLDYSFKKKLQNIDLKINYIKDEYEDKKLKRKFPKNQNYLQVQMQMQMIT